MKLYFADVDDTSLSKMNDSICAIILKKTKGTKYNDKIVCSIPVSCSILSNDENLLNHFRFYDHYKNEYKIYIWKSNKWINVVELVKNEPLNAKTDLIDLLHKGIL